MSKQFLIQSFNDKFINNISLAKYDDYNITSCDLKNSLYKLYYTNKYSHILFVASLLDNESIQFITEFHKECNILIYNNNNSKLEALHQLTKGILHKDGADGSIKIPKLVNGKLFFDKKKTKKPQIVSFLDDVSEIPKDLQDYLYPKTQLCIKMFNNSNIIHPLNLGLVSEQDKADILQQSEFYLALTEEYVPEAWATGCKVLCVQELSNLEPKTYRFSKTFQSYDNFLKVLCDKN